MTKDVSRTGSHGFFWSWIAARPRSVGVLLLVGAVVLLPYAQWWKPLQRDFLLDPRIVHVELCPAWIEDSLRESICADLAALPAVPLRDDGALLEWGESLSRSCGFIDRVEQLRRRYPDQLEVRLKLREPVAVIESNHKCWLIDAQGVVLGEAQLALELLRSRRLPVIHRPKGLGLLRPTDRIRDDACLEGLRVAREIAPFKSFLPPSLEIAVIDLSPLVIGQPGRISDIDLFTSGGVRVEWGRSCGSPRFGGLEATPESKIRFMVQMASRYPDLDGVEVIQAQFARPSGASSPPSTPITDLLSSGGREG